MKGKPELEPGRSTSYSLHHEQKVKVRDRQKLKLRYLLHSIVIPTARELAGAERPSHYTGNSAGALSERPQPPML